MAPVKVWSLSDERGTLEAGMPEGYDPEPGSIPADAFFPPRRIVPPERWSQSQYGTDHSLFRRSHLIAAKTRP